MLRELRGKRRLFLSINAIAVAICLGAASVVTASHEDSTPQDVFDSMRGSFQAGKSKRRARSLPMGPERPARWRMVDRRKRRDL